jgi:hypothetical protein
LLLHGASALKARPTEDGKQSFIRPVALDETLSMKPCHHARAWSPGTSVKEQLSLLRDALAPVSLLNCTRRPLKVLRARAAGQANFAHSNS